MNSFNILDLNWIDYSIVTIVIVSSVISLIRGFVRESISLATWILAVVVGLLLGLLAYKFFFVALVVLALIILFKVFAKRFMK